MEKRVGIWIDRRKAVIVKLDGEELETTTIDSEVGPRTRPVGGAKSKGFASHGGIAEGKQNRRHENRLQEYFERVSTAAAEASAVYIMGPGEAKGELRKALSCRSANNYCELETATKPKLTVPQIIAEVRAHFDAPLQRRVALAIPTHRDKRKESAARSGFAMNDIDE